MGAPQNFQVKHSRQIEIGGVFGASANSLKCINLWLARSDNSEFGAHNNPSLSLRLHHKVVLSFFKQQCPAKNSTRNNRHFQEPSPLPRQRISLICHFLLFGGIANR
jgi:hypothetical protein